jgi:hypothetical protein
MRVLYKVHLVYREKNSTETGKIKFISDSSIFIKEKEIKLKDIASIKRCGGKLTTIVGGSTLGASIITYKILQNYYVNKVYPHDYEGDGGLGVQLIMYAALFVSGVTTFIGGLEWATAKEYNMLNGEWKFEVKSEAELSHFHKPFPKKKKSK